MSKGYSLEEAGKMFWQAIKTMNEQEPTREKPESAAIDFTEYHKEQARQSYIRLLAKALDDTDLGVWSNNEERAEAIVDFIAMEAKKK